MDKKYWDYYYEQHGTDKGISLYSTFAEFCLNKFFIKNNMNIIELGSGNGRDAIYFAHHHHNVIAMDQSTIAIDIEKKSLNSDVSIYLHPKALDFVQGEYSQYGHIDAFYSRFTIHAITKDDEDLLLPKIYKSLNNKGLFCIEARTIKDPLFGIGEYCGNNTYITDHKRRFIDSHEFVRKVLSLGFELLYFTEEKNLSIYKDDNPVLMRIILRKI
jgi:tellurite methyltransferase